MFLTVPIAEYGASDKAIFILFNTLIGLASYIYLGHLTHRTNWQNQNWQLPAIFVLFPLLQPSQVFHSCLRAIRNLRSETSRSDVMFYLYGILAMHSLPEARDTSWIPHHRILDNPQWGAKRSHKLPWTTARLIALLTLTTAFALQSYTAWSYAFQQRSFERGDLLIIDHLCGQMAVGGACATLSCLIILGFCLEWTCKHKPIEIEYINCVDTSNAFVFDISTGILTQQWILYSASYIKHETKDLHHALSPLVLCWALGLAFLTILDIWLLFGHTFNGLTTLRLTNRRFVPDAVRNGSVQRLLPTIVGFMALAAYAGILLSGSEGS